MERDLQSNLNRRCRLASVLTFVCSLLCASPQPFDPRYIEVDRIIASNMVDVEEEPEERVVREEKNKKAHDEWVAAVAARKAEVQAVMSSQGEQAAMQLAMQQKMNPLPEPVPVPQPKTKRVEMFLVKWMGLSYSQCTWETKEGQCLHPVPALGLFPSSLLLLCAV